MEKDNKKARDDARRDYNDTIRVRVLAPWLPEDPAADNITLILILIR